MRNEDHINQCKKNLKDFESVFHRLLSGEEIDLYAEGISVMFEIVAANLFAEVPAKKGIWYDGVNGLAARIRKARQVEFSGEMWVGNVANTRIQWTEEFRATVTDKRNTKQGVWVIVWIGSDRAEGNLSFAFGLPNESSPDDYINTKSR